MVNRQQSFVKREWEKFIGIGQARISVNEISYCYGLDICCSIPGCHRDWHRCVHSFMHCVRVFLKLFSAIADHLIGSTVTRGPPS